MRNTLTRCALGGLLMALALAGCANTPSQVSLQTVAIAAGPKDTEGEAAVGIGEHLVVRLAVSGGPENNWRLASDAEPELALSNQRMEPTAAWLGAPQRALFEFKARALGQKELTFRLDPPGAGGETAPAKTYVLMVTVVE